MWKLLPHDHETFHRNTLQAVVFQLRFHPILKIGARHADFQERVRATFPQFQKISGQQVDFQLPAGAPPAVQVRSEPGYQFRSPDGDTVVNLGAAAISVTEAKHRSREALFGFVKTALDALGAEFSPIAGTRIGLRYVNLIDRDKIGTALGRSVAWSELVQPDFLQLPLAEADDGTRFYSEATAAKDPGAMTVRWGLQRGGGPIPQFRLDIDRYADGPCGLDDVQSLLHTFASDIFSVFRSSAGPALLTWARKGGSDDVQ